MLDIEQFVPNIYVKKSRDFQMFCKLLQLSANYSKLAADSITNIYLSRTCNNEMLKLLATSLNYNPKRDITDRDLRVILENYNYLIKHKGTRKGIEQAISMVVRLTGKPLQWTYSIQTYDENNVSVTDDQQYIINVSIYGDYDREYLKEFISLVAPVGFMLNDYKGISVQASTHATIEITTDADESASAAVSRVEGLDTASPKSVVSRVEVIS